MTRVGDKYLVHIESDEEGIVYECVSEHNNSKKHKEELQEWKSAHILRSTANTRKQRMAEIIRELAATDYLALKAFEGEDMSEHEGWKEERAALRSEYRQLEAQENESE